MTIERGITKQQIIGELSRSPHGKLQAYVSMTTQAAIQEPEFLARLIAWNQTHGQIRDSKTALPIISLTQFKEPEFIDNSLAHIAMLDTRNLLKAFSFAKELKVGERVGKVIKRYLRTREANWGRWEATAVQHRHTLKRLYALSHTKPTDMANVILFERHLDKSPAALPKGSVFAAIASLKNMSPAEAAGTILERKIPFLIAKGALGAKLKDPAVVMALIGRMTPSELVNSVTELETLGMKDSPVLRAAFEQALEKAAVSKKNTLKTTKAADAVKDEGTRQKLRTLQEKQITALGGPEGNWVVVCDKSGSMKHAIETGRHVAAVLARMAKGKVLLIFVDTAPRAYDATGKTYEEIARETRMVEANGGTSIGCGLRYAMESEFDANGICVVSDGGENQYPYFGTMYAQYAKKLDNEPPVYFYKVIGENSGAMEDVMKREHVEFQEFDLRAGIDYYALPNLVSTMSAKRYGLVDQIMATPLITLESVLPALAKGAA